MTKFRMKINSLQFSSSKLSELTKSIFEKTLIKNFGHHHGGSKSSKKSNFPSKFSFPDIARSLL